MNLMTQHSAFLFRQSHSRASCVYKMDRLLAFSSNFSEISQDYHPPIELDENATYILGLYSLNTYNTIANVIANVNDSIILIKERENKELWITLPEGAYEVEQIIDYINEKAFHNYSISDIQIKPNLNTQKIELFCEKTTIRFPKIASLGKLLGFSQPEYSAGIVHTSDSFVSISSVNEINVECNIISGSYHNGDRCHTLYSFYPEVPPGYKISERPNQMIYLPVSVREIKNITLRLISQKGELVDFRGEEISIQLNLRKLI